MRSVYASGHSHKSQIISADLVVRWSCDLSAGRIDTAYKISRPIVFLPMRTNVFQYFFKKI